MRLDEFGRAGNRTRTLRCEAWLYLCFASPDRDWFPLLSLSYPTVAK